MTIKEYFNDRNLRKYDKLQSDAKYCETIGDFYNAFIKPHAENLFHKKKKNLENWCELIEQYLEKDLPLYWIRKFESGGSGRNVNDNRRTGLTFLTDSTKKIKSVFAYISNFDAQELYNMILNIEKPDINEFIDLLNSGKYKFHYNPKCSESKIAAYQMLEDARNFGVMNRADLYLAHIHDANGKYIVEKLNFEKGDIDDWKPLSDWKTEGYSGVLSFSDNIKVRKVETDLTKDEINVELKARFLRFVSPFNYFLVPGKEYEVNAIFGKLKKSIGEYSKVIDYVQCRIYQDYIESDVSLKKHYENFENNTLLEDNEKIEAKLSRFKKDGSECIHIVYGSNLGEDGKNICFLEKHVSNISDLETVSDELVKNNNKLTISRDNLCKDQICEYGPKVYNYSDFLNKIVVRIKKLKLGENDKIIISTSNTKSSKVGKIKGASSKSTPTIAKKQKIEKTLDPSDIDLFIDNLDKNHEITMEICKLDGSHNIETWKANNITKDNLWSNINSRIGHRKDKDKITKVVFSV